MPAPALAMPGYLAPELGHTAEFVRDFLERELAGPGRIALAVNYSHPESYVDPADRAAEPDVTFDLGVQWPVRLADIHRCVGPAPYVGRPFVYEWLVGVDHATGRPVAATEACTRYLPERF